MTYEYQIPVSEFKRLFDEITSILSDEDSMSLIDKFIKIQFAKKERRNELIKCLKDNPGTPDPDLKALGDLMDQRPD